MFGIKLEILGRLPSQSQHQKSHLSSYSKPQTTITDISFITNKDLLSTRTPIPLMMCRGILEDMNYSSLQEAFDLDFVALLDVSEPESDDADSEYDYEVDQDTYFYGSSRQMDLIMLKQTFETLTSMNLIREFSTDPNSLNIKFIAHFEDRLRKEDEALDFHWQPHWDVMFHVGSMAGFVEHLTLQHPEKCLELLTQLDRGSIYESPEMKAKRILHKISRMVEAATEVVLTKLYPYSANPDSEGRDLLNEITLHCEALRQRQELAQIISLDFFNEDEATVEQ